MTRIVDLIAFLFLLLGVALGLEANATDSSHRILGVKKKLRTAPRDDGDRPRFRKCEIVVKGSPLDLPSGIKVKKYLKKANLTVVKVKCGREHAIVKKLRKKNVVAEENFEMYALGSVNDSYFSYQWHLHQIQAQQAWDITTGRDTATGRKVVVAVLDTGLSEFNDGFGCVVSGWSTVSDDDNFYDYDGHGTHVAGTIAQRSNNNYGTAGLAYDACIMPVKVLGDDGSGTYADIADGIVYAVDNGADVINMSLGASALTGKDTDRMIDPALQYAYANGVVVVAASGNDGYGSNVAYPSIHPTVISVGSVGYDKQRASYSNYGTGLDLVAPGGDTAVDKNGDAWPDGVLQETAIGGDMGWYFFQGTSMASPHVAGAAALLIAAGVATTPDEVKNILESTCKNVGSQGQYGAGLIQVYDALTYSTGSNTPPPTIPQPVTAPTTPQPVTAPPTPQPVTAPPTPSPTPFPTPQPTAQATENTGTVCIARRKRCDQGGGPCCQGLKCKGRGKKRCK